MKLRLILLFLVISINSCSQSNIEYKKELKPFVEFLTKQKFSTAKDYILNKFKTKDIVIISERDHRDLTQYEVIFDVLKDPEFKGNVYTETGSSNNYKRINDFLLNDKLSNSEMEKELLAIYRDLTHHLIWEKYNYYALLKTIYKINKSRAKSDKILLFPLDVSFDWKEIKCSSQYKKFKDYLYYKTVDKEIKLGTTIIDRNRVMGENFVAFYEYAKKNNPKRPKALIIENTYHGYIRIPTYKPLPTMPDIYSTGEFIYKTYPKNTTNIYVNYYTQGFAKGLTNNGLFDAAFEYTKTDNIGFDLKNTPFGNSKFDLYDFGGKDYKETTFDYIFDGMIFYKPVYKMDFAMGIPNIYPKEYEKQFFERISLILGIPYEQSVKEYSKALSEINRVEHESIPADRKEKIKAQINYWLK